jgi:hypothetical protein
MAVDWQDKGLQQYDLSRTKISLFDLLSIVQWPKDNALQNAYTICEFWSQKFGECVKILFMILMEIQTLLGGSTFSSRVVKTPQFENFNELLPYPLKGSLYKVPSIQ